MKFKLLALCGALFASTAFAQIPPTGQINREANTAAQTKGFKRPPPPLQGAEGKRPPPPLQGAEGRRPPSPVK